MAQTDLDVCNLAILRVGGEPIDALDEDTPMGAYCLRSYPAKRDWLLSKHRWVFASGIRQLARRATKPVECPFAYAFDRPSDVVGAVWSWRETARPEGGHAYVVQLGEYVTSEKPTLWAEYTRRVPEAQWPPFFVELVRVALASDIAGQVQNRSLAADLYAMAFGTPSENGEGGLLAAARIEDSRNAPQRSLGGWDDGPLTSARLGGGWGGQCFGVGRDLTFIDPPGS